MSGKSGAYERDMERLQEIVEKLSRGGLQLDEMMKLYEEGVALSAKCRKALDEYEAKLVVIDKKNGGNADA
jgi:exodeoxyribonuclease VII small subunit